MKLNNIINIKPNQDIDYSRLIEDIKTLRISSLPNHEAKLREITEKLLSYKMESLSSQRVRIHSEHRTKSLKK